MADLRFIDTNIFVRHIAGDHPEQSPRATGAFERIERGEESVQTADTVVFETVYTLQRFYRVLRPIIREALLPLLELPGVHLSGKRAYRSVFDLYVAQAPFPLPTATTPC